VTRFGRIFAFYVVVTLDSFSQRSLLVYFSTYVYGILTKKIGWARFCEIFFTNSSDHPGANPGSYGFSFFPLCSAEQDCQIFLGTTYQNVQNIPK
jgi:hypothetical protein